MDHLSFWHVGTGVITADHWPVHVYARRTFPISVNHSSNFALMVLNHQQPDLSGTLAFFLSSLTVTAKIIRICVEVFRVMKPSTC
jgi:hypothetical protein